MARFTLAPAHVARARSLPRRAGDHSRAGAGAGARKRRRARAARLRFIVERCGCREQAMNATPFTIAPLLAHAIGRETVVSHWGPDVKRILCVRLDRLGDVLM